MSKLVYKIADIIDVLWNILKRNLLVLCLLFDLYGIAYSRLNFHYLEKIGQQAEGVVYARHRLKYQGEITFYYFSVDGKDYRGRSGHEAEVGEFIPVRYLDSCPWVNFYFGR